MQERFFFVKISTMSKRTQGNIMLLFTAIIWGMAFVAQTVAMDHIGAYTFIASRFLLGGLALLPVIMVADRVRPEIRDLAPTQKKQLRKLSIKGGIVCGCILFISSSLQQVGIIYTTTAKAGFVTALYIIFVPFIGIFIRRKIHIMTWVCALIAVVGFYLLCIHEGFSINYGDLLMLFCAICFACHITAVDYFNFSGVDGIRLSCTQFFTCCVLGIIMVLIKERDIFSLAALWDAKVAILYTGICSSGIAYTLQILGQKHTEPATASLLMSMESVFAALAGWLFLHQILTLRELCGCFLVFVAVLIAQLYPDIQKKFKKSWTK